MRASPVALSSETNPGPFFKVVLEPSSASSTRQQGSVDGVHYSDEVYKVVAQMVLNSYSLQFPMNYIRSGQMSVKKQAPKATGSMSSPSYGAFVLLLSLVMIMTMDSFLGLGFLSLVLLGGPTIGMPHTCLFTRRYCVAAAAVKTPPLLLLLPETLTMRRASSLSGGG